MKQRVGIQALSLAVPHRFLELEDLARARGVEPSKLTQGLGVRQMAVADPGEDTVALAATAAARLVRSSRLDVGRLGMLVVGTETGVDHSKAVASYVQGVLRLPSGMRVYDTQHACYGGTAALMAAAEWIASGAAAGRSALVICSDIARYELGSAGEPTQGGGALALWVSEEPDLLELDLGLSGTWSAGVFDFWRPLGRREAVVDGHYSIQCYLEALSGAYEAWRTRAAAREVVRTAGDGPLESEQLARLAYHVPFPKMARKAHAHVRRLDLERRLGRRLDASEEAAEAARGSASFEAQVGPSLSVCARVGNAYTGSLYLGLAGLLENDAAALAGKRIGLFSYGSGCSSEFFTGVVGPHAAARMREADVRAVLAARQRVGFEEYEQLMRLPPDAPAPTPATPGTIRFTGVHEHRRLYAESP